ncbi:MAG: YIP1 family protein [ANME-2 cluster archaeon]|nr:YIP1 family protein [ANME-2 cluster archaeon]MBC2700124.1 YIP1 family protein [ANME-2 cluster archaeon]MBC2708778.1 YIP1 family protein [ANME-2 cluster archaeon]MBC2748262.1 YIP1 family protein [ANME-2 cluster archaeon]
MNLMERITGMITRPKETIDDISENPYIEEAVLIVGITAVFYAISAYLMQSKIIYDYGDMDVGGMETLKLITTVTPIIFALIGVFVMWVIAAGIVHLISVALGGEGKFIQMLVVYGYAYIPYIISTVVGIILMNFVDPITITISSTGASNNYMADFMSDPLYQASLVSGTLLKLWSIGLVFLGVRHIHDLSGNKALIAVALPLLSLLFGIVMTLLSSSLMG